MGVFREKIFGTKFTHQIRPSDRKRAVNPLDHTNRRPSLHASTHVRPAAVPNSNEVAKAQRRGTLHLRGISSFRSNSKTGGDQWRVDTDAPGSTSLRPSTATSHPIPYATANPRGRRRLGCQSATATPAPPAPPRPTLRPRALLLLHHNGLLSFREAARASRTVSLSPGRFRVSVSQRTTRPPVTSLSSSSRLPRPSPPPVLLPQIYIHAAPTDHHQAIKRPNPADGGKAKEGARRRRTATATGPDSQRQTPLQLQLQLRWRWPLPPRRPRPTTCPWHRRC